MQTLMMQQQEQMMQMQLMMQQMAQAIQPNGQLGQVSSVLPYYRLSLIPFFAATSNTWSSTYQRPATTENWRPHHQRQTSWHSVGQPIACERDCHAGKPDISGDLQIRRRMYQQAMSVFAS